MPCRCFNPRGGASPSSSVPSADSSYAGNRGAPDKEVGSALATWLADARGTALDAFARGTKRDHEAVLAALVEPWSTGPVEGQINRLKLLKRTMYGRGSYDLLRCRVLAAA